MKQVPTPKFSFSKLCFAVALAIGSVQSLPAQSVTATLNVGIQPQAVAVNPVTNKIYVAVNQGASVINGATGAVSTVTGGTGPQAVAVNPVTNKIYVVNNGSNNVTVVDGATDTVSATVTVGTGPVAVAVNSVTNKIYVSNRASSNVTVIDGATNSPTNVSLGSGLTLGAVAVNPVTNKIYVVELVGDVAVINGADNTFTPVTVGSTPQALAVNPVTNKIYVANGGSNTVTVIDGATNGTTPVTAGTHPFAVALNPVTNKIYVINASSNNMTVIDGATNGTTTVAVGKLPTAVVVNPLANQIYVANFTDGTVTVVDGATNTPGATPLTAGTNPTAIGINPVTNKIYVANHNNTVTLVDGAANSTATVTAGTGPFAADVNPVTHKIYVANQLANNVTVIDGATNATATVAAGTAPSSVAVNALTNQVYVGNRDSANVTVIDGATNTPTTVSLPAGIACPCASGPQSVAVNPVTNEIYVGNDNSNKVTVIDGATNTAKATPLTAGTSPGALVVMTPTNKIYVANRNSANLTVLDGVLNSDLGSVTVGAGTSPESLAVNPLTNQAFVADNGANNVAIIAGVAFQTTFAPPQLNLPQSIAVNPASSQIWLANQGGTTATAFDGTSGFFGAQTTVTTGNHPDGLSINPATNKVYVSNNTDNTISVIDGSTSNIVLTGTAAAPQTVTAGMAPGNSVVNPITGQAYILNYNSGNVTAITEQKTQAIPLTTAITPLANNQTSSPTPAFTFTTTSAFTPNAPTPQNVYFQIDTWQGPWMAASGAAPTFTATTAALGLGPHIIYAFATDGQSQDSEGSGTIGQIAAYWFAVVRAPSTAAVKSDVNPSSQNQTVTFTATISASNGTPTGTVTLMDGANPLSGPLNLSSGQATLATSALTVGSHSITAVYAGDLNFTGSTSPAVTQNVLSATTTTVVSSLNPSLPGQSVTFTASVSASSGTPTGTVTFMDGANPLTTASLSAQQATLVTSSLAQGSHSITVVYSGDANFAGSTSAVLAQVVLSATTTTVVSSANPSSLNQSVTFTATVSAASGTPTGTVTFTDGANPLGTSTLVSGQATFNTTSLALGSHSIVAAYAGDANFQGSASAALAQAVLSGTTTSLGSSVNPSLPGQPVTFTANVSASGGTPTGSVTFKDGANPLVTAPLSSGQASFVTSSLALGSHSITAVYGGDVNFTGSASAVVTQVVLSATTTAMASNVNPSGLNEAVTFTATVGANGGKPTGTVTFKDGIATLGTATLSNLLQATFTANTLTPGSHSISAVYGGDANFGGSTSSVLTQVVTSQPPDFSVATNSASATVVAGQSTTFNFTVTPNNGFTSPISFSCSGQPAGVTCSFNPQTVTPNGGGALTTMLTVSTTTSVAMLDSPAQPRLAATFIARQGLWLPAIFGLAGLLLAGQRRPPKQRKQRRKRGLLVLGFVVCLALAGLAGCGGRSSPSLTTATFNVVATSGGTSHSTSVTLTITH